MELTHTQLTTVTFILALIVSILLNLLFPSSSKKKTNDETSTETTAQPTKKEKAVGGEIKILFATQTGTSESFANTLAEDLSSPTNNDFDVEVLDIEDIGTTEEEIKSALNNSRVVFLLSTYGEGGPSDNAVSFIEIMEQKSNLKGPASENILLSDQKDPTFCSTLEYAVFGCGNSEYAHYNAMAKLVYEALGCCGAKAICEMGLGDDNEDTERDFIQWKDSVLIPKLQKKYIVSS